MFQQSRSAAPRRSRLAHALAVEEPTTNVLAEGDESGAAASGESDASPIGPPSGAAAATGAGAAGSAAGERSSQSLSGSGASAQTSPEHTASAAAGGAGGASASASTAGAAGGVKPQTQALPTSNSNSSSLSHKPSRFVTTKAPDDSLKTADTAAKALDDDTRAHAILCHFCLRCL